MDLDKALGIAARGMDAQTTRLRVIAENLANQDTTGSTPGADPYRRKTVTFENRLDRQLGTRDGAGEADRPATTASSRSATIRPIPRPTPTATSSCRTSTASSR